MFLAIIIDTIFFNLSSFLISKPLTFWLMIAHWYGQVSLGPSFLVLMCPVSCWGGCVIGVRDLTEVLGILRRFVVVVGVVVWPIAFVVQSKVRFVAVRHGCSVVSSINRLCVVWKQAPACRVWNVNAPHVSSSWCEPLWYVSVPKWYFWGDFT